MKKNYFTLLCLLFSLPFYAQTDGWYVQVGVFEDKVDINYFQKLGSNIYHAHDAYGFHRYYAGVYTNESEASTVAEKVKQMGYNAYVTSQEVLGNSCRCNYIPEPKSVLGSIQNIFFDFDRSFLRPESKKQLNDLATILKDFPSYSTTLRAHTDSKGSNSYNESLSLRRADSAKRYLRSRGIASSRIQTETFGEGNPIAKNELSGGQDTEEGRQFNRRVEIIILDQGGHQLNAMVDQIEIPTSLEN